MTRIVATSDLHGSLPPIPECDILILGGDLCLKPPSKSVVVDGKVTIQRQEETPIWQRQWLDTSFRSWLDEIPAKHVVGVAGNHDLIFEKSPELLPSGLRWHYLEHTLIELEGLKIFGMPWVIPVWGAFNRRPEYLEWKYSQIPDDVDIVVSHGPPYKIGDAAPRRSYTAENECLWPEPEYCGSSALRKRILEIKPKLTFFGHIHEGYGIYEVDGVRFANVALMNQIYVPANEPMIFDI